jgi:hypothetical protein
VKDQNNRLPQIPEEVNRRLGQEEGIATKHIYERQIETCSFPINGPEHVGQPSKAPLSPGSQKRRPAQTRKAHREVC